MYLYLVHIFMYIVCTFVFAYHMLCGYNYGCVPNLVSCPAVLAE